MPTLKSRLGGTWFGGSADPGGGRELGIAHDAVGIALTGTAATDYPGLSVPVSVGVRPVRIVVELPCVYPTIAAGQYTIVYIVEDGIGIQAAYKSLTVGSYDNFHIEKRSAPAPGPHVYKVQFQNQGGTTVFNSIAASFIDPYIQVLEC